MRCPPRVDVSLTCCRAPAWCGNREAGQQRQRGGMSRWGLRTQVAGQITKECTCTRMMDTQGQAAQTRRGWQSVVYTGRRHPHMRGGAVTAAVAAGRRRDRDQAINQTKPSAAPCSQRKAPGWVGGGARRRAPGAWAGLAIRVQQLPMEGCTAAEEQPWLQQEWGLAGPRPCGSGSRGAAGAPRASTGCNSSLCWPGIAAWPVLQGGKDVG